MPKRLNDHVKEAVVFAGVRQTLKIRVICVPNHCSADVSRHF